MSEKKKENHISRRKFLKRAVRTAGYALPTVTVIKLNTIDAWAKNYDAQKQRRSTGGGCTPLK